MAALFPKIYDIIDKNPTKHEILRWREPTSTEVLATETWDRFLLKPLEPPGALSLLLLRQEPMYELGSVALRKQLLMETLLTMHERVDKELVGRRYPRKKIQDLLAAELSSLKPSGSPLLDEVLCELFQVQKITLNRKLKSVSFSPPDPRLWTPTKQVIFGDEDSMWSFTPTSDLSLGAWLLQKQEDGWKVSWPTADGKYEEMKMSLTQRGIAFTPKQKKDELAHVLGKSQALETLSKIYVKGTS
jgi:hypothetical protein